MAAVQDDADILGPVSSSFALCERCPKRVKRRPDGPKSYFRCTPTPDIAGRPGHVGKVPCVDGSGLARTFFTPQDDLLSALPMIV